MAPGYARGCTRGVPAHDRSALSAPSQGRSVPDMTPADHASAILQGLLGLDVAGIEHALADPRHGAYAHAEALADAADSTDERERSAGIHALFAGVVEVLNDSFEPAGRAIYAQLFPHVIWRSASRDPRLVAALQAEGIPSLEALCARYARARCGSHGQPGVATAAQAQPPPLRIAVLSRVTIGADILLTSIALQRLHQRFPQAELHLLGDRKLAGLFAGLPRVAVTPLAYPRRGPLHERLGGWLQLREAVTRLQADLVVAADSRLDQLGILPVIAAERYLLWENLQPQGPPRSLAELLDRWLVSRLGLEPEPPCLPRLGLDAATAQLSEHLGLRLGRGPWVAVKFDHGGNPAKALPRQAEVAILRALRAQGWRILIDRGFGPDELASSDALMRALGGSFRDIDESGQGLGEPVQDAAAKAWEREAVVRFHGSIAGWAAAVCQCRLAVSYDSVGHHLAAAVECPVIVVFTGYADERFPVSWQPRGAAKVSMITIPEERKLDVESWQRVVAAIPLALDAYAPRECG
jgi:ADP-heptose:LPS heptosyltransferase